MRLNPYRLLYATALSTCIVLPALAQDDTTPSEDAVVAVVDQELTSDVLAQMDLILAAGATGADVIANANGNITSADILSGDIDFNAVQRQDGRVQSSASLTGGPLNGGDASLNSTAYGNAATSSTTLGTDFHTVTQTSNGDVTATGTILLDGADVVKATTTAAANLSTYSVEDGTIRGFQTQTGNADVTALTTTDLCCNNTSVLVNSVASGNSVTATGKTATSFNGAVQLMATGTNILAATDVTVQSGTSVIGSSTAAGNSVTVHNEWGFATLGRDGSELYQGNGADTTALTHVDLGSWSGTSGAVAYGVGNSGLISNIGSDTGLFANQENLGDVLSSAIFSGDTQDGSHGYASATSFGNALTATLCYTCSSDGTLTGKVSQSNSGTITAFGSVNTTGNGYVQGSAIAIGNTATFQTIGTE